MVLQRQVVEYFLKYPVSFYKKKEHAIEHNEDTDNDVERSHGRRSQLLNDEAAYAADQFSGFRYDLISIWLYGFVKR